MPSSEKTTTSRWLYRRWQLVFLHTSADMKPSLAQKRNQGATVQAAVPIEGQQTPHCSLRQIAAALKMRARALSVCNVTEVK